jgi:hypothetical protein
VTESEYSHGKESISNMQKRNRRIRPEILELSSKFGIIFVTEAYNESILLQDKEMYLVEICGTYLSLFFSERDHLTLQQNIHESISRGKVIQPSNSSYKNNNMVNAAKDLSIPRRNAWKLLKHTRQL